MILAIWMKLTSALKLGIFITTAWNSMTSVNFWTITGLDFGQCHEITFCVYIVKCSLAFIAIDIRHILSTPIQACIPIYI